MNNPNNSRTFAARLFAAGLLLASASNAVASVHYVDVNGTNPTPPYTNWATAAEAIQDAVDAAAAGEEIVVTNGIYATGGQDGNRVVVRKPLKLRSINGPQFTIIAGGASVRCVYLANGASLSGFTLKNGDVWSRGWPVPSGLGGGVACESTNSVVFNCELVGNTANYGGGAVGGTLNNCTLTRNGAGSGWNEYAAGHFGGYGGGAELSNLNSCTLTGNWASYEADEADYCILNNCIVYSSFNRWIYASSLNHCWTASDPLFVDYAEGNLRLQSNSPCINAGINALAPAGTDLDGNARIVAGTVDIGAYEFQLPTSAISYTWLQHYGLSIDGSADIADPDGDGMNNWQEWRCGTNPTNAISALRLLPPTTDGTNMIVTWQSVAGADYFLEHGTNLAESPAFTPLATHIFGQPGTTTYTDTIGEGLWFYRVGVRD